MDPETRRLRDALKLALSYLRQFENAGELDDMRVARVSVNALRALRRDIERVRDGR